MRGPAGCRAAPRSKGFFLITPLHLLAEPLRNAGFCSSWSRSGALLRQNCSFAQTAQYREMNASICRSKTAGHWASAERWSPEWSESQAGVVCFSTSVDRLVNNVIVFPDDW